MNAIQLKKKGVFTPDPMTRVRAEGTERSSEGASVRTLPRFEWITRDTRRFVWRSAATLGRDASRALPRLAVKPAVKRADLLFVIRSQQPLFEQLGTQQRDRVGVRLRGDCESTPRRVATPNQLPSPANIVLAFIN